VWGLDVALLGLDVISAVLCVIRVGLRYGLVGLTCDLCGFVCDPCEAGPLIPTTRCRWAFSQTRQEVIFALLVMGLL